jgi:non-heme chloroperoxidase
MNVPGGRWLLLCMTAVTAFCQANSQSPIREGFATTGDGIRIHYLQSGDARSSHALVLIPGWRLPAFLWEEQLKKFGPSTRVIAVDPRSQSESTKVVDGNTPESRAKDYHDVLSKLGVTQPVLVGWSQGAQDVAAYVQEFGSDSVGGVVFVDSVVSAGPAAIELHKEASKAELSGMSLYARHPKEFSEGMLHAIFKKPLPDEYFQKLLKALLQTPTDTGVAMLAMDMFGVDRRPALSKVNKPALVIASAESEELAAQKEMAASIPGAKFLVIEDAAHAVFVDQPEKFDAALAGFLQSLPR